MSTDSEKVAEDSVTRQDDVPKTVIEMRGARVAFDMDRGQSVVLDDVDMDIRRDEILGIVGESGSGKSMFASAMLDAIVEPGILSGEIVYYPAEGSEIIVNDLEPEELRKLRWEEISMVFQGAMSSFNPTLTIKGHFVETLKAHDRNVEDGLERAHTILEDLYLDPERVFGAYAHELSGGMKQRALISLSLLLEPEVLVMDEPTAALDLLMQRSILKLLKEIQANYDLTIVFITHDLPLVIELADRLAVMYSFEFVEYGTKEEILKSSSHPYTRALLYATPNLDTPLEKMNAIEGSSPDPVNVPTGCSYHPRCPLADDNCRTTAPDYHDVSVTHKSACFHWDRVDTEIEKRVGAADDTKPTSPVEESDDRSVNAELVSLESVEVHFENRTTVLDRFFGTPEVVHAVDGVDLQIRENDMIALIGESGCGKTTLGKTAIGLQRPTGGTVNYRGQDIWESRDNTTSFGLGNGSKVDIAYPEIRRSLQIIHQDPGSSLNPNRKVMSILAEPLRKWTDDSIKERREQILDMLETVGMTPPEDYARRYPHQLSGGEKQRVALIRSLLLNPDLILADEAISALDVSLRIEMMDLLLELQEEFDTSILFISHDLSNARYLTQKANGRIGIMYLGKLVEVGSAEQIIDDPKHPYTQILRWATPDLDAEKGDELPIRKIDIPDPSNPPSGCRFHTRCPEARTACTVEQPELETDEHGHQVACFRDDESHEYWDSDPIAGQ